MSLRLLPLILLLLPTAFAAADDSPLRHTIDTELRAVWKRQKLTPAPLAEDALFLRRVHLDLVGDIPTAEQARAFLDDPQPKKREKLVDQLLADPRFASHQAEEWDLVLFGRNPGGGDAIRKRDSFRAWLAGKFAKNVAFHQVVRELLLGEEPGSEMFLAQFRNRPEDATETVSRVLMGTQLQCARCHDHPYENWTQRDFYGMAGFFVRLVVAETPGKGGSTFKIGEKSSGDVLFSGSAKEQRPGRKGEPIKPKFLGGANLEEPALPKDFKEPALKESKLPPRPAFSRKTKLAEWVVANDNPYFARALANRVWGQLMGRGIVHPVDDLGGKSPVSHPELLDALTKNLASKFDLKGYMREIVLSEGYQLSNRGPSREALPRWYERARVRPLSAEELLTVMRTATSFDTSGGKIQGGTQDYFRIAFGKPTNGLGEFQGGLGEHLFLNNSPQVRGLISRRKGNLADQMLTASAPWEKRVETLFLATLSRRPSEAEQKKFVAHLTSDSKADPLVEEAIWALLNCSEFRFNH